MASEMLMNRLFLLLTVAILGWPAVGRAEEPVALSDDVTPPVLVQSVYPAWDPFGVTEAKKQGRVRVFARVQPDGTVSDVWIPPHSGLYVLDAPALAAMKQWRFRPAMRSDELVAAVV